MFLSVQTFKCIQKMSAKIAMFKTSSKKRAVMGNNSLQLFKYGNQNVLIDQLFIH